MKRTISKSNVPKRFDELTRLRPLRPIRDESDLDLAQEIAGRLAVLDHRDRDQEDYLHTLSLLIEAYEQVHHAIDLSDLDITQILRSLMADHAMSASALGRIMGNRTLGAAVLRGDRQLSKANILALCDFFAVGPELFLMSGKHARKVG